MDRRSSSQRSVHWSRRSKRPHLRTSPRSPRSARGSRFPDEKQWAVQAFMALLDVANEGFDPDAVKVWGPTHGWSLKDAKDLGELARAV